MNDHRDGPVEADENTLLRRWYAASTRSKPMPSGELLARIERVHRGRQTFRNLAVAAVVIVAVVGGVAGAGVWANFRSASGSISSPSAVAPTSGTPSPLPTDSTRPQSPSPAIQGASGPALAEHEYIVQMHRTRDGGWLLTGSRLLVTDGSSWQDCWASTGGVFNAPYPYALVAGRTIRVFEGATMWTSTNGCATWAHSPLPVLVTGAAFPTDSTGYVAYVDLSNQNPTAQIFRTDDAGGHWTATPGKVAGAPGPGGSAFGGLLSLAFADADHGWLTDGFTLWSTADGAGSWTRTVLPVPVSVHGQRDVITTPVVGADGSAVVVAKYDATAGMDGARGQRVFYRTVERGAHWTATSVVDDPGMLTLSLDDPTAWIALDPSDAATVRTSSDAGATWQTTAVRERWPFIAGPISFADSSHGWVVVQEPSPPCTPVALPTNMAVACSYAFTPPQHLVATDDGGATWRELKP
jgi:hypothetical protein